LMHFRPLSDENRAAVAGLPGLVSILVNVNFAIQAGGGLGAEQVLTEH